jgi:hypothetical protein
MNKKTMEAMKMIFKKSLTTLKGANDLEIGSGVMSTIKLVIETHHLNLDVHAVDHLPVEMLLGQDFLFAAKAVLDYSTKTATLFGERHDMKCLTRQVQTRRNYS